jgi:hypothetical protein
MQNTDSETDPKLTGKDLLIGVSIALGVVAIVVMIAPVINWVVTHWYDWWL